MPLSFTRRTTATTTISTLKATIAALKHTEVNIDNGVDLDEVEGNVTVDQALVESLYAEFNARQQQVQQQATGH